ncbi:MAG TPA: 16S rRNA processing protein RimM [Sediminispirochaeta sp.]|nr:16S rRNA processing protein RimM [Sediminispirochaeta sp.]
MDSLAVGIVRSSHGVKGYVKVKSFSGEVEHFFQMTEVILKTTSQEKVYRIEDVKALGDGLSIKFVEVHSPEEGKLLAGAEIWVDRSQAAPLREGEYYAADLIGCDLLLKGRTVGRVKALRENGVSDLLEVQYGSRSRLVPLTEQFIGRIDTEGKTIELKEDWVLQ